MKFRENALVFLYIVAWLILAGLAVADSDTCCLVDALSSLGSYFPHRDLPSQTGFLYALSSLKRLFTVLSGMCLLVLKQQDLKRFM